MNSNEGRTPFKVTVPVLVSILLTLMLTACERPDDKAKSKRSGSTEFSHAIEPNVGSSSKTTFTRGGPEAQKCEEKLKAQMVSRAIKLKPVAAAAGMLKNATGEVPAALTNAQLNTKYEVTVVKDNVATVDVKHSKMNSQMEYTLGYMLTKADLSSKGLFNLVVTGTTLFNFTSQEIAQQFLVSGDCQLRLSKTVIETISKKSSTSGPQAPPNADQVYQLEKTSVYANGKVDTKTSEASAPQDAYISQLEPSSALSFENSLNRNLYTLMSGKLVHVKILDLKTVKSVTEFGKAIALRQFELSAYPAGSDVLKISFGIDSEELFQLTQFGDKKVWQVSEETWKQVNLGKPETIESYFQFLLPSNYLLNNNQVTLVAGMPLSYDHLSAYWQATEISTTSADSAASSVTDKTSQTKTYQLLENPEATITAGTGLDDLASNSTIQVDLPEVQAIAKKIQTTATTRQQKLKGILQFLNQNYSYDQEMVDNQFIHAMTTQEALVSRKLVCQHYAILFAAIARAMQIPTRVVIGFVWKGDRSVGHAWNESEIESGKWRVIEPQDPNSLSLIKTRFYLPLMRGVPLEDQDAKISDDFVKPFFAKYILSPAGN